jgi:sugar lactone lactonase YvrE
MKTTAKLTLTVLFGLTSAAASFADTTQTTVVTTTTPAPVVVVVRDGFTEEHSQVMITRNGVTRLVSDNMRLHNGIVVRPDGIVIVPGVTNKTLHAGDWLAFDGTLTRADSGKVEYLQPER